MKKPDLTIYFNPTCPHCQAALGFIAAELPNASIDGYELGGDNAENRNKFMETMRECKLDSPAVPLIITGNGQCFQGFSPDIGDEIKHAVKKV